MSSPIQPYSLSPHNAKLRIVDGRVVAEAGPTRRRRVVIYGAAGGSVVRRRIPWDSDGWEIWAINNFWNVSRDSAGRLRADIWWEQHQIFPDEDGPERGKAIQDDHDMAWIRTCPVPLYVTEPFPANPNAVVWPIEYYAAQYRDYFTCTFAMQMAEAIDVGFEEIAIFGLGLLSGTQREATVESSCLNYWLGLAEGKGVKLSIDRDSFLLQHPYRYGHQYWLERRFVEEYLRRWDERPVAI